MPSIEKLKRKAQNAVYTAGELAQGAAVAAGDRAGTLKDTAKTNVALMSERRRLDESFRAIGEWYVATCGDHPPEAVADIVKTARASQEKIAVLRSRGEPVDENEPQG